MGHHPATGSTDVATTVVAADSGSSLWGGVALAVLIAIILYCIYYFLRKKK